MLLMASGGLGIIQVANKFPDSKTWQFLAHQMEHVEWLGCTLWDLIQPSFMFLVGVAITGQTFHSFTLDNLRYFGTLKAMGATNGKLLGMIVLQAMIVGFIGYGLGVGAASLFGWLTSTSELAFRLPWQLLVLSGTAVLLICAGSAFVSIFKVFRLEPAIVFKG